MNLHGPSSIDGTSTSSSFSSSQSIISESQSNQYLPSISQLFRHTGVNENPIPNFSNYNFPDNEFRHSQFLMSSTNYVKRMLTNPCTHSGHRLNGAIEQTIRNTGNNQFVCPTCQKSFTLSSNLRRHQKVHSDERPFACEYEGCNKTFTESAHRTKHYRWHRGEKPFICDLGCGKAFATKYHLKRHQSTRVHQNTTQS